MIKILFRQRETPRIIPSGSSADIYSDPLYRHLPDNSYVSFDGFIYLSVFNDLILCLHVVYRLPPLYVTRLQSRNSFDSILDEVVSLIPNDVNLK
jgi:hypothetical protein